MDSSRWWYRYLSVRVWNAEMQLNEKGYYFAVLVLDCFLLRLIKRPFGTSMKAYRHFHLLYDLPDCLYYLCCITVVGLWNATLLLSEKGYYGLASS